MISLTPRCSSDVDIGNLLNWFCTMDAPWMVRRPLHIYILFRRSRAAGVPLNAMMPSRYWYHAPVTPVPSMPAPEIESPVCTYIALQTLSYGRCLPEWYGNPHVSVFSFQRFIPCRPSRITRCPPNVQINSFYRYHPYHYGTPAYLRHARQSSISGALLMVCNSWWNGGSSS
jgi:hypothetical protein